MELSHCRYHLPCILVGQTYSKRHCEYGMLDLNGESVSGTGEGLFQRGICWVTYATLIWWTENCKLVDAGMSLSLMFWTGRLRYNWDASRRHTLALKFDTYFFYFCGISSKGCGVLVVEYAAPAVLSLHHYF